MKHLLHKLLSILFLLSFTSFLNPAVSQTTRFDVENTNSNSALANMFVMSGNRVGLLTFDAAGSNLFFQIFNSTGTRTSNINITNSIAWNHNHRFSVNFRAIQLDNGNIFIAHYTLTNSSGFQHLNIRYTIISDAGAVVSSGQLNSTNNTTNFLTGLMLDKLSDGKIVAVFRSQHLNQVVFRLFTATGVPEGNQVAISGAGTANNFTSTYAFRLAAGRNGGFMVTAHYWLGGIRGHVFTNTGASAFPAGTNHFLFENDASNDYANIGLAALPNGNYALGWYRRQDFYTKIVTGAGADVSSNTLVGTGSFQSLIANNSQGAEGYYVVETRRQVLYDMSNPYSAQFIRRYNQNATHQETVNSQHGWLIEPQFSILSGRGGGYVTVARYFKSFELFEDMPGEYWATPTGDDDLTGYMVDFSMTTLPVTLIRYDASLTAGNFAKLQWATGSEENNSHFEIAKSYDGRQFSTIGRVAGKISASATSAYEFLDQEKLLQTAYYRLQQVDIDGRVTELGTRIVRVQKDAASIFIYPNPVQGNILTINTANAAASSYQVVDLQGRIMQAGTISSGRKELSIENLRPGTYFIRVGEQVLKLQRQ